MEVLVAVAVIGIAFVSLYAGMASGFSLVALSRENLRANQIMMDRLEECRLYTWEYLTNPTNVPTAFTTPFYPTNSDVSLSDLSRGSVVVGHDFTFYGTLTITNAGLTNTYRDNLRLIVVTLTWTNGNVPRNRSVSTYVARNGMQSYIYLE